MKRSLVLLAVLALASSVSFADNDRRDNDRDDRDRDNRDHHQITASVPEPTSISLLAAGVVGMMFMRRKSKV